MMQLQGLKYGLIGIFNTLIHFCVFLAACNFFNQSISNLLAFSVAVCFSYVMNATFTFKKRLTIKEFLKMYVVMGVLAFISGYSGDYYNYSPIVTFVGYCIFSYVVGFLLTRYWVFK
jgi:putative flippase GtrA